MSRVCPDRPWDRDRGHPSLEESVRSNVPEVCSMLLRCNAFGALIAQATEATAPRPVRVSPSAAPLAAGASAGVRAADDSHQTNPRLTGREWPRARGHTLQCKDDIDAIAEPHVKLARDISRLPTAAITVQHCTYIHTVCTELQWWHIRYRVPRHVFIKQS